MSTPTRVLVSAGSILATPSRYHSRERFLAFIVGDQQKRWDSNDSRRSHFTQAKCSFVPAVGSGLWRLDVRASSMKSSIERKHAPWVFWISHGVSAPSFGLTESIEF